MKEVLLDSICEINPRKIASLDGESFCSFIPMEYIDDRFGIVMKKAIRQIKDVEKGYTPFQNGDILFAKITPCMENGKVAVAEGLVNGIGFGSTEFHVLRAKVGVNAKWIYYYIRQKSIRDKAERCMTGSAGQKRVPSNFLEELAIPLPSFDEQKRIAHLLEKADRLRRLRHYALELSDEYLQAVFLEMFGDPVTNPMGWDIDYLHQLCNKIVDCPHSTPTYTTMPTYYACVRSSDIQDGHMDWSTTKYVSHEEYAKRVQILVPKPDDVVYCREGARFGNAAIIPHIKQVCLGQRMMLFRANLEIATPEFIWAFLESRSTYKHVSRLAGGSASPHLNVADIKEIATIIPPLSLQQDFAHIVQKYERLRAQQREAERQAEHLFQTLLHQAFQGELSADVEAVLHTEEQKVQMFGGELDDEVKVDMDARQLAFPLE